MMLIRELVKVVKDTTLTESADALSPALMKLEGGEVLELLTEPTPQGDLLRARCRVMGASEHLGWVRHLFNRAFSKPVRSP